MNGISWAQFPGGVSNNLQIWVKADEGTGTSIDNAQVAIWSNQRIGGVDGIANQGIPGNYADPGIGVRPVYRAATSIPNFNFNPAIEIVSTNGYRAGYKFPLGFPDNTTNAITSYTHLSRTGSTNYRTVFVMNGTARSSNISDIAGVWQSPFFGTYGNRPEFYNEKEFGDVFFGSNTISTVGTDIPSIQSYYNSISGGSMGYFFDNNGLSYGGPSNNVSSTANYPGMVLLMDNDGGNGSTSLAGDRIGEFILYSETQTAAERQRVNSYLAIKYGITLEQPQDYLTSDGSVSWNSAADTTFNNNIFGLALDNNSVLNQKVSNSINSNTILTVANDNDFISANTAATRTPFAQDKTFLVLGDNNVTDISLVAMGNPSTFSRIQRIWRVQRTNDTGKTYLQVDLSSYPDIPAATALNKVYMIVANDPAFGTNLQYIPALSFLGGTAVFDYEFPSDKYISFGAGNAFCTREPNTTPATAFTKIGITGYSTKQNNWPENIPNGFIALESGSEGMVITRTTPANIPVPVEGMIIYDTSANCFSLYNGSAWKCMVRACNN
ncbi:hypothetical protein ACM46_05655 [Chryseobacterium angstadtii]|uniref:DUF8202 domain-containing protein n=1 Tax=Chryseobacterium angstadtii TaxID=558151 RepID=A0A0J7IH07_9FLAO|nr:hypothetical protein [Chryseobacterium angstadtii]KMQ65387.1 hypothetical protein ACM46_05655 [Chryseobacterium angstadtii]